MLILLKQNIINCQAFYHTSTTCMFSVPPVTIQHSIPLPSHRKRVNRMALLSREYWMIYRGPGFLAVVWIGSSTSPSPKPLPSATCLSFSVFLCDAGRAYRRERGRKGWERSQIIPWRESLVHPVCLKCKFTIVFSESSFKREHII